MCVCVCVFKGVCVLRSGHRKDTRQTTTRSEREERRDRESENRERREKRKGRDERRGEDQRREEKRREENRTRQKNKWISLLKTGKAHCSLNSGNDCFL